MTDPGRDGRFYSILLNHSILLPSESILESIIFGNDSGSIDSVSTKESVNQNRLTS